MIGSISDTIVLLIIALLLLGGEKNIPEVARNIGKFYQELKRRQAEFTSEIRKELGSLDEIKPTRVASEINQELVREVSYTSHSPSTAYENYNDKIAQLENEIRKLKAELERLKQDGNKN